VFFVILSLVKGGGITSSPVLSADGARLYFGSLDHSLYALNAVTGALIMKVDCSFPIFATPSLGLGSMVYISSSVGSFHALDMSSGVEDWFFLAGNTVQSGATVGSDGTIYFGSADLNVYALDPLGNLLWKFQVTRSK
jgi:outer membrane protein assembly factor BamB